MKPAASEPYYGDLYCEYYLAESDGQGDVRRAALREYVPGLLLAGIAALASAFLANQYGFPVMLLGLLIGLGLSFAGEGEKVATGLDFASRRLLQVGIALLGLQVGLAQVLALGWQGLLGVLLVMAGTFAAGIGAARMMGEGREAGILAGGATAICGASAAMALYGVIGRERLDQARFAITLVGVALASAIAMSFYPAFAKLAGMSDAQAGFLIGASVHDAAQAIGGGFSFSNEAGASATVVKLARVAMLGPIVALVAFWLSRSGGAPSQQRGVRFSMPWFVLAFLALAVAGNAIAVPEAWRAGALDFSKAALLLAVIATAMRSRLELLREAGWRPLVPVAAASLTAFALASGVALFAIA
ncbi:YeiH family protein [Paraurantiacibacter namhicola]|uniref:Sulfate exporter family transporter n=1 Tax=Paraurantiacibacter namhicola TaxID=645517 RepID=A0A1C7D4K1_9SPHN|nr:putative sulfate exporter family transporter [Paraurantiacibacter namhicola]ANU06396.1 hypothetical protein A6F65_00068 [Paraurantiacibacter namhicola]